MSLTRTLFFEVGCHHGLFSNCCCPPQHFHSDLQRDWRMERMKRWSIPLCWHTIKRHMLIISRGPQVSFPLSFLPLCTCWSMPVCDRTVDVHNASDPKLQIKTELPLSQNPPSSREKHTLLSKSLGSILLHLLFVKKKIFFSNNIINWSKVTVKIIIIFMKCLQNTLVKIPQW